MSEKTEKAAELHSQGCNCSQAVVGAFCEKYGLDQKDAIRMAAGFGGGMRRGEVCGAVTGALMVLGLKDGARAPEEKDRKADADSKTADFMKAFQERNGSYLCRDILKAAGKKICPKVINDAVEMLEERGY